MVVRGLLWDIWSEWWGLLIEELRRHDLAYTKTNTKTKMKTLTRTFRINPQRAIIETYDLWNIWSEWWGHLQRRWQTQRQRCDMACEHAWNYWQPRTWAHNNEWDGMGRLVNSSCHIWHICVQTKVLFNMCFSSPSQTSQIYVEFVVSVYITHYNCMLISFLNFDRKSQRKKGFCTISCYCRKRVLWNKYLIVCLQDKRQQNDGKHHGLTLTSPSGAHAWWFLASGNSGNSSMNPFILYLGGMMVGQYGVFG